MALGPRGRLGVLLGVGVPSVLLAIGTTQVSFQRAQRVEFCGSCHVMTTFVEDMRDSHSEKLAALHFKNRWIRENQCYTCHTNYDFLGPIDAKWRGMRHLVAYYLSDSRPPKLYRSFPNQNCLQCHGESADYLEDEGHADLIADLASEATSCLECHEDIHPKPESK
jgi:nitrate/TMAO reductase-like tetraheme cytochrome c subunit